MSVANNLALFYSISDEMNVFFQICSFLSFFTIIFAMQSLVLYVSR